MSNKWFVLVVWMMVATVADAADLCVTGLNSGTRKDWINIEAITCGQTVAFKDHGGDSWSVSVYHPDSYDTTRELLSANVLDSKGGTWKLDFDPNGLSISRQAVIVNGVVKGWITTYRFGFTFTAQSGTFTVSMPTSRAKTAPRVSTAITFK